MASKKQLISLIEATKQYLISNENMLPDNQYTDELCDWINQVLEEEKENKNALCPNCLSNDIYYVIDNGPNEDVAECGCCRKLIEVNNLIKKEEQCSTSPSTPKTETKQPKRLRK